MKIRKKTSFMLLAASTAAVVGVAAVSFAAWTGNNGNLTASAATGSAYLFGFGTANPEVELSKDLVPYNQVNGYDTTTCATSATLTLPDYEVVGAYSITVELDDVITNADGEAASLATGTSFYVTAQTDKTVSATMSLEGWEQIDADGATFTYNDATAGEVKNKVLTFILVSENSADMNLSVQFNVTLTDLTPAQG